MQIAFVLASGLLSAAAMWGVEAVRKSRRPSLLLFVVVLLAVLVPASGVTVIAYTAGRALPVLVIVVMHAASAVAVIAVCGVRGTWTMPNIYGLADKDIGVIRHAAARRRYESD